MSLRLTPLPKYGMEYITILSSCQDKFEKKLDENFTSAVHYMPLSLF